MDDIPERALGWYRDGAQVAIATVIETWGSAPRRAGAQMVIAKDGRVEGSVSGGCVEGAVIAESRDAIDRQEARCLEYGVSDGDAFAVGLACGGRIKVLVEPVGEALSPELLGELVEARARRVPVAYVVELGSGKARLDLSGHRERFSRDQSGLEPDGATFVAIHAPALRLVVVGAVHIAQALVGMARRLGYDATVIDPRESFATPERFPDVRLCHDWPDDALRDMPLDERSALCTLSHDPKFDDPALMAAVSSPAFYIGALGSSRTHAARLERLRRAGVSEADCARIHGPIGLQIGASGPSEIAVSVLAEMTRVLRTGR